jgi:hypothetical protein
MKAAGKIAESSLTLMIMSKNSVSAREAAEILTLASLALKNVDRNASKAFAQRAVHTYPLCWKILKSC